MNIRVMCYFTTALVLASATLALTFAPSANASIVGSTYDFTTSESGTTLITPLGGPTVHTDPANPGFCLGFDCTGGVGVSGSFGFAKVSPTLDTITYTFFGSVDPGPGTFDVDLGHFTTLDGEMVTAVSHASGNFIGGHGDFSNVTFNGTDAVFTGSVGANDFFDALGGTSVVFNVTTATVPEPATLFLIGLGLLSTGLARRHRKI